MMKIQKFLALLFIALFATVGQVEAAENPALTAQDGAASNISEDDINVPEDPPSVCDGDAGTGVLHVWLTQIVHSLCIRGDADSLLAAYLITLPPFGSHGDADHLLLARAYAIGKNNPRVLWAVALDNDCRPYIECRKNRRDVAAAKALTRIDPDNAMAWFALAYAEGNYVTTPDRSALALQHAAQAPRVHDYGFDLLKLATVATGRIPIPKAALDNGYGVLQPPELTRWGLVNTTPLLSYLFGVWISERCGMRDGEETLVERAKKCDAAKAQFKRGDSLLTLSENPTASAAMQADVKQRPVGISNGDGKADMEYAKAIIAAIAESSNEREMYTKLMPRLGRK